MTVYAATDDPSFVYFGLQYKDYDGSLLFENPDARGELVGYISRADMKL